MENKKYERKNGTGVLFTNDKIQSDKHPNMSGTILTPDGKEYRIAAWTKQGSKGKYLSLALSEKQNSNSQAETNNDLLNDLPF